MLAFSDLMDFGRNDLPLKYLEEVSNGLLPTRARGLGRELLRWGVVLALPQI